MFLIVLVLVHVLVLVGRDSCMLIVHLKQGVIGVSTFSELLSPVKHESVCGDPLILMLMFVNKRLLISTISAHRSKRSTFCLSTIRLDPDTATSTPTRR